MLIVDDNATNRRFFLDVLSRWKMRPEAVADGPAALERLVEAAAKQSPFDLILLDVLMPGMDGIAVAERIRQHPALATTPILILSSAHRAEDAERGRRLGVERYVTKPVTPSDLQNAIIAALRLSFEKCREALPAARAVPKRRLQILLAEDNEINQKLAVRLLERAGHEVTVVDHGADAVAEFERHPYDLILMDVQMPHMDGFAATAAIRAREHATGGHIPIVAMTAHALKGDRERCLAAGMDDYLAKPIQPEEVARVLDDVCNSLAAAPRAADGNVTASAEEESMPFDVSEALARVDGDRAFLVELAEMLSVDCHRRLETIRNALAANDSATWRREAHTLKGSFGTFAAAAAQAAAQQLESLADGSNGPAIEEAFRRLEAEIHRLVPALSKIARTHDGQAAGAS